MTSWNMGGTLKPLQFYILEHLWNCVGDNRLLKSCVGVMLRLQDIEKPHFAVEVPVIEVARSC